MLRTEPLNANGDGELSSRSSAPGSAPAPPPPSALRRCTPGRALEVAKPRCHQERYATLPATARSPGSRKAAHERRGPRLSRFGAALAFPVLLIAPCDVERRQPILAPDDPALVGRPPLVRRIEAAEMNLDLAAGSARRSRARSACPAREHRGCPSPQLHPRRTVGARAAHDSRISVTAR